jgi:hypothetical protein
MCIRTRSFVLHSPLPPSYHARCLMPGNGYTSNDWLSCPTVVGSNTLESAVRNPAKLRCSNVTSGDIDSGTNFIGRQSPDAFIGLNITSGEAQHSAGGRELTIESSVPLQTYKGGCVACAHSHCARAIFTLSLLLALCRRRFTFINTRNHTASHALVGTTHSSTLTHACLLARLHAHSHNLTPRSRATHIHQRLHTHACLLACTRTHTTSRHARVQHAIPNAHTSHNADDRHVRVSLQHGAVAVEAGRAPIVLQQLSQQRSVQLHCIQRRHLVDLVSSPSRFSLWLCFLCCACVLSVVTV